MAQGQMTSASFFSGVGGLDLGFERAGIRTVSFSEIEPYQSSVLRRHWPNVPNLGDIVALRDREFSQQVQHAADEVQRRSGHANVGGGGTGSTDWRNADIFTGGFPCQDLSIAGSRKGFRGDRSVLAFTFLDLVERYKPEFLVLENVPGLLSSSQGRDFGRLISEVEKLGYGVAWRILDAQYFGVPQRRRRVFIVASLGDDRCGEVLFECEGSCRHTEESTQAEEGPAARVGGSAHQQSDGTRSWDGTSQADTNGMREADGMARWVDYRRGPVGSLTSPKRGFRIGAEEASAGHIQVYRQSGHYAGFEEASVGSTLRALGGDLGGGSENLVSGYPPADLRGSKLAKRGTDSKRYACCGNGVVSPVAEWIGRRLIKVFQRGHAFGHA